MLKFCTLLLLLPLSAFAEQDCQLSVLNNQMSIECSQIQVTNRVRPDSQHMTIYFIDGFIISFRVASNDNTFRINLGDRKQAVLSAADLNNIHDVADFVKKYAPNSSMTLIEFFENLPAEESLEGLVLLGGEVPWPIIDPNQEEKDQ